MRSIQSLSVASLALSLAILACDDSKATETQIRAKSSNNEEITAPPSSSGPPEEHREDVEVPAGEELTPPGQAASPKSGRDDSPHSAEQGTTPSPTKPATNTKNQPTASKDESKRRREPKKGAWRDLGPPSDLSELTPEEREGWRVIQHIRKNYDHQDFERERQEYMREIDEMREARKRGEGGSRMGALVAPADTDAKASGDDTK